MTNDNRSNSFLDRQVNRLQDSSVDIIKKVMGGFVLAMLRPLALTNELILRRDFGERYLSQQNAMLGGILIAIATAPFSMLDAISRGRLVIFDWANWSSADRANFAIGLIWLAVFALRAAMEFRGIKQRYVQKTLWHSYSIGWSPLDKLIKPENQGVWLAVFGIILMVCHVAPISLLMFLSGTLSASSRKTEETRFHNLILDMLDRQIEHEQLASAVMERSDPRKTQGFVAPVRAYVSKPHREKFIQAITPVGIRQPDQAPASV